MDVVNRLDRLRLTEETVRGDFFIGSTLESQAAEQAATLVLLLSSERGALTEMSFLELQRRLGQLRDRGLEININSLVNGTGELEQAGFLNLRQEGCKLFIQPTPQLLNAVDPPDDQ
jgi:hypothetical protein